MMNVDSEIGYMTEKGLFTSKALRARARKWTKDADAHRRTGNIKEAEKWEEAVADCYRIIKEQHDRRMANPYRASAETLARARAARK